MSDVSPHGPKPKHHVNPTHVPGQGLRGGPNKKALQPSDAESVYGSAVPGSPSNPKHWFGVNSDGKTYRFSDANDGTAHFTGIVGESPNEGQKPIEITKYEKERLK